MLREDKAAEFRTFKYLEEQGFFRSTWRTLFYLHTSCFDTARFNPGFLGMGERWEQAGPLWTEEAHEQLVVSQRTVPELLTTYQRRQYWFFQDRIWWEDDDCTAEEVVALVAARTHRRKRTIQRARAVAAIGSGSAIDNARIPLSDEVKTEVWRRDRGRCIRCGSAQNLEFDHVIPLSKGGANTVRNIQLLCQECNRSKGGDLV